MSDLRQLIQTAITAAQSAAAAAQTAATAAQAAAAAAQALANAQYDEVPGTVGDRAGEVPLTVILAAIAATIDQPYRVISITSAQKRPVAPPVIAAAGIWSQEGRRQHFTSHQTR